MLDVAFVAELQSLARRSGDLHDAANRLQRVFLAEAGAMPGIGTVVPDHSLCRIGHQITAIRKICKRKIAYP